MKTELAEKNSETQVAKAQTETFVQPSYRSFPGEESHELQVVMPGVTKDGVHVALEGDELTIVGHRRHGLPEGWNPVYRELRDDNYRLRLRLNIPVDEERITARVEDGELYLTLPIHEAAKPRVIAVT